MSHCSRDHELTCTKKCVFLVRVCRKCVIIVSFVFRSRQRARNLTQSIVGIVGERKNPSVAVKKAPLTRLAKSVGDISRTPSRWRTAFLTLFPAPEELVTPPSRFISFHHSDGEHSFRCSALIAVRSTLRAFMIDTISHESKPSMIALIASSLAFLNQVLEGRADLRRFCRVQSFGSQGKHRIKSSFADSLKHQYLSFTWVYCANYGWNINPLKINLHCVTITNP